MIPLTLKKRSQHSERRAASEIGGRQMPASGAITGMKGDVKSSLFLLEDKFTDAGSYSLKLDILQKAEKEAFQSRRKPLLRVTMKGQTFYVMPLRVFQYLLNEHKSNVT